MGLIAPRLLHFLQHAPVPLLRVGLLCIAVYDVFLALRGNPAAMVATLFYQLFP